jgi:hypothetical protein
MKLGIIGESKNHISYLMLLYSLKIPDVEIIWFVEASISSQKKEKLYGKIFDFGIFINFIRVVKNFFKKENCKKLCKLNDIKYIKPVNLSINNGLPQEMYDNPCVDYVLIAGCDQLLNKNGLKLAKNKIINYHYSALPAYKGKFVVFWQWYNHEPFIGYSFHEIDLGIDTGKVIFQDKVTYTCSDSLPEISSRVILESAKNIHKLYEYINNNESKVLTDKLISSVYPSKKFQEFITVTNSKTMKEAIELIDKIGYFKLPNGLTISRILETRSDNLNSNLINYQGIYIQLKDGVILGRPFIHIPFFIIRIIVGDKRLLGKIS